MFRLMNTTLYPEIWAKVKAFNGKTNSISVTASAKSGRKYVLILRIAAGKIHSI
jgi:hypothetical protein